MKHLYALVDCNNFFASCERIFRPDLANKPVAVLSNNDGCIIARSAEVKALGVPMGAPLFKVNEIVKKGGVTLFSANFELYGDISERIVRVLREVTPLIEVYSIDECFLDLSELPEDTNWNTWAIMLKKRIFQEVGLPVSIGIAETKTLAKVASTHAKKRPEGVEVVDTLEHRELLLRDLPVEDIWGVGWRMAPKLRDKGISTAWQLVSASDAWLKQQFNIAGLKMIDELKGTPRLTFGDTHEQRKTIMRSRSFGHTIRAAYELESALATFGAQAAARLRAQDSVCSDVIVYLYTKNDEVQRRLYQAVRLGEATADTGVIIAAAIEALATVYDESMAYKKAGVILSGIVDSHAWQLSLVSPIPNRDARSSLMQSVDMLNKKYGYVMYFASEHLGQQRWHSKHALRSPRYTTSFSELPLLSP